MKDHRSLSLKFASNPYSGTVLLVLTLVNCSLAFPHEESPQQIISSHIQHCTLTGSGVVAQMEIDSARVHVVRRLSDVIAVEQLRHLHLAAAHLLVLLLRRCRLVSLRRATRAQISLLL